MKGSTSSAKNINMFRQREKEEIYFLSISFSCAIRTLYKLQKVERILWSSPGFYFSISFPLTSLSFSPMLLGLFPLTHRLPFTFLWGTHSSLLSFFQIQKKSWKEIEKENKNLQKSPQLLFLCLPLKYHKYNPLLPFPIATCYLLSLSLSL